MKWYTINEEYLQYLRNFESRIPKIDYGNDKLKPFFGALFKIGDLVYVTQVSHPQTRHNFLKQSVDFVKLYDGEKLIAVVNLNYMFPVHKDNLIEVNYKNVGEFRTFENETKKNAYITLLKKEMKEIKNNEIGTKAIKLYNRKYEYPEDRIALRCIDFKYLEQKCNEKQDKKV